MATSLFGLLRKGTRKTLRLRREKGWMGPPRSGPVPPERSLPDGRRSFADSRKNVVESVYPEAEIPQVPLHEFVFANLGGREKEIAVECGLTGRKRTFGDVFRTCQGVANSLLKKLKLQKGDRFAIVLPNCPEYPILLLAGSMSGIVPTTVNPSYTPIEMAHQLKETDSKVIFTVIESHRKCEQAAEMIKKKIPIVIVKSFPDSEIPDGAISFGDLADHSSCGDFAPVDADPEEDVVLPYSSGTSGLPKGVRLTHRNLVSNLIQFRSVNELKSDQDKGSDQSLILGVLPMYHIYGMVATTLDSISKGCKLISLPRFEPKLFVETIYRKKVEIIYLVPPLVFFLGNAALVEPKHLESVQHVVVGAAPCGAKDLEKLMKKGRNLHVFTGYGMTETSPIITITHKDRIGKISSAGHPVPSTAVKVADVNTGEPLPKGKEGEIRVKGPQVMKGYLNRPEETKNMFDEDGWLKTGDVGYYDEEKDFYVIDRIKELIKVKGFQVAPAELEEFIRTHPKVSDVGVVGVEHPQDGEVPKAFVVLKEGVSCTPEDIANYVKEGLSSYKQLKGGVTFLEQIPKSNSGKILRKNLKKLNG